MIPGDLLAGWKLTTTTTVEGTLNGMDLGRRGLKAWDDNWFIEVPAPLCKKAQVDTGSVVDVELRLASEELPDELHSLLREDATARRAWEALTPSQQRMHRENVAAAKGTATRTKRARTVLGLPA